MSIDVAAVPRPIEADDEMRELARFHRNVTWTGTIEAGGMGPGTPRMTAVGQARHERIQDGLWIVGNYQQDQFLTDGTFVLRWKLHWVAGWDPIQREYRATVADNYGHTEILRGWIDGDLLTFQSVGDAAIRLRLVWHLVDEHTMIWRNEASVQGGPFNLVERYECQTVER